MRRYTFTCPLCHQILYAKTAAPVAAPEDRRQLGIAVGQAQMAHVSEHHGEIFRRMMDLSSQYSVALFMKLFLTSDETLASIRMEVLDCATKTLTGEWNFIQQPEPPPPPPPTKM